MNIFIFFDQFHLLITDDSADFKNHTYSLILSEPEKVTEFEQHPRPLFAGFEGNIGIYSPLVEESLETIFANLDGIVAAGGIVENEQGDVLVIFRKGFWDLPKGKVEKGETIIDAAEREVTEETGINVSAVIDTPQKTYHCYTMKGKDCIKETFWYPMNADFAQQLVPQTEEDITELKWMSQSEFLAKKDGFYPLIASLLAHHFKQKG